MNDKVKSLFFTQYYGQPILQWQGESLVVNNTTIKQQENGEYKEDYLLLRDISQLTDEEANAIKDVFGWVNVSNQQVINYCNEAVKDNFIRIDVFSILLRFGIILPFTYLSETNQPLTLTPAEIIALGWAKIKSNEQ